MDETRTLVRFLAGLKYEDLPSKVVTEAKLALLDLFGVGLFASRMEWSKMVCEIIEEAGCRRESAVWGHSFRATAQYAALVNGTACHGIEMDDRKPSLRLHQGSVTVPAALAAAEKAKADGKTLLTAVVAGYEAPYRVSRCLRYPRQGIHTPGHMGIFGAVAAASKALSLPQDQMLNAFGIAGSMSSGITEFSQDPKGTMVKRLHAGWASQGGVTAALLAGKGFTGPSTVLEGKYGYCNLFTDEPPIDPTQLVKDLGEHFQILDREVKAYAAWGGSHTIIEAVKRLKNEYNVDPEQIERIVIGGSQKFISQHEMREPQSIMAAQYSIPFVTAIAFYADMSDPSIWTEGALRDERILRLSRKVEWYVEDEAERISQKTHEYAGVKVDVRLANGKQLRAAVDKPKGSLENPMTADELRGKFRSLARHVLSTKRLEQIIQMVDSIESVSNVSRLGKLLLA